MALGRVLGSVVTGLGRVVTGLGGVGTLEVGGGVVVLVILKDNELDEIAHVQEADVLASCFVEDGGAENVVVDEFLEALEGSVFTGNLNDLTLGGLNVVHRGGRQELLKDALRSSGGRG